MTEKNYIKNIKFTDKLNNFKFFSVRNPLIFAIILLK